MDDLIKRQKDMHWGLWFGTIVLVTVVILFWTIPFISKEIDLIRKTIFTVAVAICVPLAWILFYHQKKIDANKIAQEKNIKEKTFRGVNVVHGISFKIESIRYILLLIVFFVGGIYFLITGGPYWWIGLILIGIACLLPIAIKTFWKVGKQKLKGRYY